MAGPSRTPYLIRRACRRVAPETLLVFAALLLLCSCGGAGSGTDRNSSAGGGNRVYRNSTFGFHFVYPSGLHARTVFIDYPRVLRVLFRGAVATNLSTRRPFFEANARDLSKLPAEAAVLLIEHMDGGPMPWLEMPEAHFPLRPTAFGSIRGVTLPKGASWREQSFAANGWNFLADVYFGSRASKADRAAIWRVVSSLRFKSLRTGQRTGDGRFLVLRKQSSYPIGFVKRMNANTFLVRAPHGFYGIGGLAMGTPTTFPCALRFDQPKFEIACVDGSRRWDRMGQPLWKGASWRNNLGVLVAVKVGQDGHVLFCSYEVGYGNRTRERMYWGNESL